MKNLTKKQRRVEIRETIFAIVAWMIFFVLLAIAIYIMVNGVGLDPK